MWNEATSLYKRKSSHKLISHASDLHGLMTHDKQDCRWRNPRRSTHFTETFQISHGSMTRISVILFTPVRRARTSLRQFSRTCQISSSNALRCIPDFTKNRTINVESRGKNSFTKWYALFNDTFQLHM
jgi:hypothetical protein